MINQGQPQPTNAEKGKPLMLPVFVLASGAFSFLPVVACDCLRLAVFEGQGYKMVTALPIAGNSMLTFNPEKSVKYLPGQ